MSDQGTKEYYIELFNSQNGPVKPGKPEGEGQGSGESMDQSVAKKKAGSKARANFAEQFTGTVDITTLETIKESTYQLNDNNYLTINRSKFRGIENNPEPSTEPISTPTSQQTYSLISRGDGMRGTLTISEPYSFDDGREFIELTAVLYNFPEEFKNSRDDVNFEGYTFGSEFENNGNLLGISNLFLKNELNPDLKLYGLKGDIEIDNREIEEAEVIKVFESTLVDKNTFEPIVNATIDDGKGNQTKTDKNGNFKIQIPLNKIDPKPAKLIISSPNYSQETITPVTQDGNVRDTLGIIPLTTTKEQIQEDERNEILLPEPQIKSLQALKTDFETKKQIAINNLIIRLKTVLLPQILNMIALFGISKIQEALGKKFGDLNATCPANIDELNKLIARKNKLTKALNNLYNFLETVEVGVNILDKTITAADIALTTAQALTFVPSTIATPIPSAASNIVEKIRRELKKYKIISSSTLLVLEILTEILFKIIQYLNLLDSLIEGCTQQLPESSQPEQVQQQISNDLLRATEEQSKQLSPVVTNVNGFEMGVISEDGETDFSLKRRQAIAKNKAGVIMLRGELSFSSNDQILIDELVFYIKQNDLKAD